jgi:tetratricopeptide (TPR) repeat protein
MERGVKARELAFQSPTGAEALTHWKMAIESFENAAALSPDSDAANQASQAKKQQDQEQKYLTLLNEARRLRDIAEQKTEGDGVARLAAWSDAQRPIGAALVLYERGEARALSDTIEQKLKDLRAALQDAEQARSNYDSRIARARTAVREAKKYLNPSVALPHWETAANLFKDLTRDYPARADEFTLEQREADENRDKAYLYDKLGIVPSKIEERVQDIPVKPGEKAKVPSKGIEVKAR